MKAAKKSSIRKAAGTRIKAAVRRKTSSSGTSADRDPQKRRGPVVKPSIELPVRANAPREKRRVRIPPILLEGDRPGTAPYAKHLQAPATQQAERHVSETRVASLPEAYGTQRLKLTPRDPHWVHAHWDFTREQLRQANAQAGEGLLRLRLFKDSIEGPALSETPVHADSVRWFVHVPEPNTPYAAEIGFYNHRREWSALAISATVRTPPAGPSLDRGFEMATLGPDGSVSRHGTTQQWKLPESLPGVGKQFGEAGFNSIGSGALDASSPTVGFPGSAGFAPSSPGIASWSSADVLSSPGSPMGGIHQSAFRLEVNAELIVYGATEPNARLQIGDRTILLQEDGSFRLRFTLPEGTHVLPLKATSAGTGEQRKADLRFSRHTEATGEVTAGPQEPGLKPPSAENL